MKKVFTYFSIGVLVLLLSTCRKYDEGGTIHAARRHLFGERKDNATKTWKLKLYEVNGVDSTYLIPGADKIPDYYDRFITFKLDNHIGSTFSAQTHLYNYAGELGNAYKDIVIAMLSVPISAHASAQCSIINNDTICSRNLFRPLGYKGSSLWEITKLTKKELVLINNSSTENSCKIILSQ